jgi:thiosulfate dehydrogenase (quinone) large subunit
MSTLSEHRTSIIAPRTTPEGGDDTRTAAHHGAGPTPAARWRGYPPAVLRIAMGFVFLWAFLDKTFGLGYATSSARAWIHGGSPTRGFLSAVSAGPLQSTFHSWAGESWADWMFMLGLASIGVALLFGVALRPAAAAGTLMIALMWAAEWPLARHASDGTATGSSNPILDYHVIYALALIALVAVSAGRRWGLGATWTRLALVQRHPWLA